MRVWRSVIGCMVALAVVLGAQAAFCAAPSADESDIKSLAWGPPVALPWDGQKAEGKPLAEAVNAEISFVRKGAPGEARRYRIRRINLSLDRTGKIGSRMVAEGTIRRTLLREVTPGRWAQKLEWERFAVGQTTGPENHPTPAAMPGARGISYEFAPDNFDFINIPGAFDQVGDPMAGYLMKVLAMDVSGWDALALMLQERFGESASIGADGYEGPLAEAWEITEAGGKGRAGQYRLGESRISIAGITRWRGEPCALIWFSAEGNEVDQDMSGGGISVRMTGTEYFRALMTVSLLDARVVAGEIWGPVPAVMKLGTDGREPKEIPVGAVLQQISYWEFSGDGDAAPSQ